jgi:phenylacetic acid degradation operon negative regulatory protein
MARPKARTLIFAILGDFVRFGGREIRLKALVAMGEQLGVSAANMRVLVARMCEQGWLEVRREGRESIYSVTPKTMQTLEEGRKRIFRGEPPAWSGSWSMVIYTVPESDRPTREQLRRDLSWLGFGPLAPATWVSPHPILDQVVDLGAALPNAQLELLTMQSGGLADDQSIASRCWDLEALNEEYAEFVRDLQKKLPVFRSDLDDPTESFVERIELVNEYRQFPNRDPGLPKDLQPPGWLGERARTLFLEAHQLLAQTTQRYYESLLGAAERRRGAAQTEG